MTTQRPVVSTQEPRNWWDYRRPQTDAERLELAAMTWVADERMERARIVRDRHPDVFEPSQLVVLGLEQYEKLRQKAQAAGKQLRIPPIDVDAIDAAAEYLRANRDRPNPDGVNRKQMRLFPDVARSSLEAAKDAYLAWQAAIDEARHALGRWYAAHETLGQPKTHGENRTHPPRFSDALDSALGGYGPRPAPMLPQE